MIYFVTALPFESRAIFHFWGKGVLLKQQGTMRLFELAPGIRLVEVGVGLADGLQLAKWWAEMSPRMVVNIGISGALVEDFSVGDAVVVQKTCNETGDTLQLTPLSVRGWPSVIQVTVAEPVESEVRAQALHQRTGATLVDMELYGIVRELQNRYRVPVYSVRVVSDFANHDARQTIREQRATIAGALRHVVKQLRTHFQLTQ